MSMRPGHYAEIVGVSPEQAQEPAPATLLERLRRAGVEIADRATLGQAQRHIRELLRAQEKPWPKNTVLVGRGPLQQRLGPPETDEPDRVLPDQFLLPDGEKMG